MRVGRTSPTPKSAPNWFRENIAWAAGLFEGEGCISYADKEHRSALLMISMVDLDVVQKFYDVIQLGRIGSVKPRCSNHQVQWRWTVRGFEDIQAILAALWTGLGSRRRARSKEVLLRMRNNTPATKLDIKDVSRIRELHEQGTSVRFLAEQYKVGVGTIKDAVSRRTWRNV